MLTWWKLQWFPYWKISFDDSYGSNYRNDNQLIMQGNWWGFVAKQKT